MTEPVSKLLIPTEEEFRICESTMAVKAIDSRDYPDWEKRLADPARDPRKVMRAQRQEMSDCQGQSLANGEEKRHWYCTGQMVQLADIYAYNGSEYVSHPNNVGKDQGTSITAGVQLLTQGIKSLNVKPGLFLESDWPYRTYERSASRFAARAQESAHKIQGTYVTQHGEMPDFQGMLVAVAAGGSGHIGTYWPPRWSSAPGDQHRLMDTAPTGGGGHATEIIWAVQLAGRWYLVVWNSHGDQYYLMSQRCYETLQAKQFRPFGAYVLMPDEPVRRYNYEDWRKVVKT